ncbi:MAG TPA: ATP-binding protein [Polyangiaceae bacterium]|nr:ATP-binding protein [Polyangiaceae bacterium]
MSLTIGPTENLEEASRALAPSLGPGHHAEFYDDAAYPALAIAAYLAEALRAGGAAVAIAADLHLSELRSALVASDVDVAGEVDRGRLLLLDGDETLAALCRDGEPDDGAFEDVIGRLVRSLAGRFGNVRAFGEMVDILCRSGRASSALALEGLWNHLRASVPFDLLCAYGLTSFERAGAEPDFTRVCDAHGRVRISSADESAGLDPARLTAHLEQRRRALDYEAGRRAQLEAEQLRHASAEKHLAAVTRLLSSSLEYDETVGRVAELAVPAFGDWCAVDLLSDDYRVCSRVSVARRSAAGTVALVRRDLRSPEVADCVGRVTVERRSEVRRDAGREELRAIGFDGEHLAALGPLRSWIVAPLVARGRAIGALSLGACERNFDARDVWVAEQLAATAACAIDNARLHHATQQALARAEEASRLKDEFLATVSHELRTPLNAVLGWAAILARKAPEAATLAKGLAAIRRNAEAQTKIIEDILDVSRMVTGKLRLDPRPIDMIALVRDALDVVRPSADAKGIALGFVVEPHDAGCLLIGDGPRLQQAVWNLLSNAVKFTPPAGRVGVHVVQDGPHVDVIVTDSGCGIDPAFLPHVFDAFRQADGSSTRTFAGLGLGLALVRHIVELHGGHVVAESAGRGEGATFRMVLPVRVAARLAGSAQRPVAPATPPELAPDELGDVRVLVVDDEPDSRDVLERILREAGATVVVAGSAAEAIAAVDRFRPSVIVSDIGLPGEDGNAFIRGVRARGGQEGGLVPAIALTAYARSEERILALASGYSAHLAKPADPTELIALVASLRRLSRPG